MGKLHIFMYFGILSLSTPIGIIIGMVITEDAGTWVIGILQAIAGGTLLYIAFYEVLDREKLKKAKMTGLLGCLLITIGFYSMAGLEAIGGHSHGHGVVEKDHNLHPAKNLMVLNHAHIHEHGDRHLENASQLLKQGILKYEQEDHDHK